MTQAAFILLAYLMGSISFGILVSRAFGLPDPRTVGSGNPGATNVLRSGKKLPAVLTLLGDAAKGWLAVLLAQHYGLLDAYICLAGLAAFIGHLYPVFCGFKGGKGVATALGVLLAFSGWLGLSVLVVWAIAFAIWRYSSLAALIAAGIAPISAWFLLPYKGYAATAFILALLLIWRHKSNIQKLINGSESGFSDKK
ncbi:MAG: glycerol-3-phosphate 1-O-acyltransferase PlsY [Methylophilaceae bacterium]|nr:glycerol-3-phosphate 1-O-acyltransferase PlsY [Methylophilaceae bacterium]